MNKEKILNDIGAVIVDNLPEGIGIRDEANLISSVQHRLDEILNSITGEGIPQQALDLLVIATELGKSEDRQKLAIASEIKRLVGELFPAPPQESE